MNRWDLSEFTGKEVVFIGRAREGLSFEKFIGKHGQAASFRFVDQKDDPDYLNSLKSLNLEKALVLKSAGVPGRLVPVPYTTPTNIFFRLALQTKATILGITGTKGKSTISSLVDHLLRAAGMHSVLCGNIGKPMIDYLDEAKDGTIFVVELGAYQTVDMTQSPHIGLINNLYHEHLDYFGSIDAYFAAKKQMIANMRPQDTFVYNPEFTNLIAWAEAARSKTVAIDWSELDTIDLSATKLLGEHNRRNILSALTVVRQLIDIDESTLSSALADFTPLSHRLQVVATANDVTYIDDAISTTPESAIAALEAIETVGCMFLGGQDRGYDFTELGKKLAEYKVPSLVLFPDTGERIKASLPEGYAPKILETSDMGEAIDFARLHTPKYTAVLLSTASPSYNLWKDFEAKGDEFQAIVKQLR